MKLLLTVAFLAASAAAQQETTRERALQEKLVAACCWSETIANHRSATALEMKVALRRMIEAGQTDAQILTAFQDQYGKRVLIEPEGASSILIYTVPAVVGLMGLSGVAWLLRRWLRAQPIESVSH